MTIFARTYADPQVLALIFNWNSIKMFTASQVLDSVLSFPSIPSAGVLAGGHHSSLQLHYSLQETC